MVTKEFGRNYVSIYIACLKLKILSIISEFLLIMLLEYLHFGEI